MGKLVVDVARILPLCTLLLLLPSFAAAQCPPAITVQRVWTQDTGGKDKTNFVLGETIQFAALVSSNYGGSGQTSLSITTSFYNDTKTVNIPLGSSTWNWTATAPSTPGSSTVTVKLIDPFCGMWVSASASFTIGQSSQPPPATSAPPGQAPQPPAASQSVTLSITQGPVNTGVTASGTGWPAGAVVHVFFNQQEIPGAPAIVDSNGGFTLNFCVPNLSPGVYPTFFTLSQAGMYSGPIFTITAGTAGNCQSTTNNCPDVYFIGVHGTLQDAGSPELDETWKIFDANRPADQTARYISLVYHSPDFKSWEDAANLFFPAEQEGLKNLNVLIRKENNGILKNCPTQRIVLVGYSLGSWIVNDWLSKNENLWSHIRAVVLYGDPLWHRSGQGFSYAGLAAGLPFTPDPYMNTPPGPGVGISDRWQSWCIQKDPVCGEVYPLVGSVHQPSQVIDAKACPQANCEHLKYTQKQGYDLTTTGGKWLASQVFPSH